MRFVGSRWWHKAFDFAILVRAHNIVELVVALFRQVNANPAILAVAILATISVLAIYKYSIVFDGGSINIADIC
jgi:hypothetical protein